MAELTIHEYGSDEIHDHPFSYEQLGKINWDDPMSIVQYDGYEAVVFFNVDNSFIRLQKTKKQTNEAPTLKSNQSEGCKVHMSIFDAKDGDQNLDKAWMIVLQTSIENNVQMVKIIRHKYRNKMRSSDKCGKEITWYAFKDNFSSVQAEKFLTELTQKFILRAVRHLPFRWVI